MMLLWLSWLVRLAWWEGGAELGEGVTWQLEGGVTEHRGDMSQAQLGGWMVTPQEGGSEAGDQLDIQQYLDMYQAENTVDMYSTQVDGDPGDDELEDPGTAAQPSMHSMTVEGDEVPAVPVACPQQMVLLSNDVEKNPGPPRLVQLFVNFLRHFEDKNLLESIYNVDNYIFSGPKDKLQLMGLQ